MTPRGDQRLTPPDLTGERYRPRAHVIVLVRGDRTFLFDTLRAVYYTLNRVGAEIWTLVEWGVPRTTMVQRLRKVYDVPVTQLDADVAELLDRLLTMDLIERDG